MNRVLTEKSDDNADNKNPKEIVNTNNNNNNNEEEEQINSMNNEEYQIILMRTLHIIQINLDFSLQKEDVYIQGLLRVMNKNLPLYFDLLNDNFEKEIYEDSEVMS